jgi:hypothetical protein
VLHPQSISPILFYIIWTTITNTWRTLVHKVIMIVKHQNHLAKWARVHFLYSLPPFWWLMITQPKQANIAITWCKNALYSIGCMNVPIMWDYGLKPPPNSIIHILRILDQKHHKHPFVKIKILNLVVLVFDILWIALVSRTSPLWNQTPKRKILKDLPSKEITTLKRKFSPCGKAFSHFQGKRHTPYQKTHYIRKAHEYKRK